MVPASAQVSLATANTSDPTDVSGKSQTATFFHRNVCFTMDFPSKRIKCSGENHLITSIAQCLGEGHLLCRDCQFTSSPPILTEKPKCPFDGTDIVDDIAETRSFRHTKISCPSITTFEPHHKPACTWEGPYQEVKSHLDECIGIPDRTKLMMQGLQIKELQGKLTNAEKKQSTMIESLNQKYETLDQRFYQKLKQDSDGLMPLLGGTIGYVCNSIEAIDKIRTRLDRLEARTGNMEQQSNGAVRRCIRQFVAANLAAERRYLTNLQRAILTAGTLSPVASPDNTGKCVDVFLWRIDGFQSWLADAVSKKNQSYYSPAVYTTDCYCVSGQISPYEHDSGRSYLRVYVALWEGQYDKQISWPMSKIITLSLVNQNDPCKNEAVTFASDDKPGFQTPPNLVNTGWGFPKFLMLNDLDNTEFVKNDSLHLEIVLEDPLPRSGAPEGH